MEGLTGTVSVPQLPTHTHTHSAGILTIPLTFTCNVTYSGSDEINSLLCCKILTRLIVVVIVNEILMP